MLAQVLSGGGGLEGESGSADAADSLSWPRDAGASGIGGGGPTDVEGGDGCDGGGGGELAMSRVLIAQRDRLRARVRSLEAEVLTLRERAVADSREREKLEQDNVKLYEKIRYLQRYGGGHASAVGDVGSGGGGDGESDPEGVSSVGAGGSLGRGLMRVLGGLGRRSHSPMSSSSSSVSPASFGSGAAVEARYARLYEQHLDPFREFNSRERRSHMRHLNSADRLLFSGARVLLSNRVARQVLALYWVFLHLLVFYSMAHHTHVEGEAVPAAAAGTFTPATTSAGAVGSGSGRG